MIVPRSWTKLEKQHSEEQISSLAEPAATDIRFKLASLFLLGCWFITVYSLRSSIKHYIIGDQRNGAFSYFNSIPPKFRLALILSLTLVCYESACSFDFSISPLSLNTKLGMVYGLGWAVPFLIVSVLSISGYVEENDDLELERQRGLRDFRSGHVVAQRPMDLEWASEMPRVSSPISVIDT